MSDPKKPEELNEDDLSEIKGGVAGRGDDHKDRDRTKGLGKGGSFPSKPPVSTQAGASPDD